MEFMDKNTQISYFIVFVYCTCMFYTFHLYEHIQSKIEIITDKFSGLKAFLMGKIRISFKCMVDFLHAVYSGF